MGKYIAKYYETRVKEYVIEDADSEEDVKQQLINGIDCGAFQHPDTIVGDHCEIREVTELDQFPEKCYELYKLDWMKRSGYTFKDLIQFLKNAYTDAISSDQINISTTPDEDIDLLFKTLESQGFQGSLYVCFNEFMDYEFQDEDYMQYLLDDSDFSYWKEHYMTGQIGEKSLAKLKAGDIFMKGGKEFIVLNQESGKTRICLNGYHGEDMQFDAGNCPDYKSSDLKEYCDTEVYEEFAEIFGEDNICEEEVFLITMDGQKKYGICNCRVRPLTFDEWRKYNQYLPKEVFNEWYWLCTPWSTPDRGWEHSVAVCGNAGTLYGNSALYSGRCAPACVISSSVKVEQVYPAIRREERQRGEK